MIKFWKSAAKGKSGCPVRPPEQERSSKNIDTTPSNIYSLDAIPENEEADTSVFTKKSRLSITLYDVLSDKNIANYFIQYMESIGAFLLIKCWLDLDNFREVVLSSNNITKTSETQTKVTRTKSCNLESSLRKTVELPITFRRHSCMIDSESTLPTKSSDNCTNFNNIQDTSICEKTDKTSYCKNKDCTDCNDQNHNIDIAEEAISLFKKYVALEVSVKLDLPDNVRKVVISNICHPEGHIKEDCFKVVQDLVFAKIEKTYFEGFQKSSLYTKAQIDILTNSSLTLNDILYNGTILFFFTEYLEQESASSLLEFIMAIMHFRDNLLNANTHDADQTQDDAIVLYNKYFSLQATNPLGFPTHVRLKVEGDICREGGPLHDCFDWPYLIVYKTLTHYVKSFSESEIYYRYLSEMIHSVDEAWTSPRKAHSDCSSEFSISTQNTLLAMGDPAFGKRKRNHSVPDMTIDSNQLYNADSLWQRKRHDGLNLGRVNSLGRFESKFEPDPDKKQKSVLKKMVNRFVPMNKSLVEEEMAWQIAHMIVKDITDLTMSPPDNET